MSLAKSAHCGIFGNEAVDCAVRGACDEDHTNVTKVPFTDFQQKISENVKTLWYEHWRSISQEKGKWYTKIQNTPPHVPWYNKFKEANSRQFITTINRLRFGHCRIPAHLFKLRLATDKNCQFCVNEVADLKHIVMKCHKYSINRLILVSELDDVSNGDSPLQTGVRMDLEEILSNPLYFKPIYRYIVNTIGNV